MVGTLFTRDGVITAAVSQFLVFKADSLRFVSYTLELPTWLLNDGVYSSTIQPAHGLAHTYS